MIGVGIVLLPLGIQALRLNATAGDPAALSRLALEPVLTASRAAQEIDAALEAGDPGLAESFVALADQRGVGVAPERRTAVAEANETTILGAAGDFARGAVIGEVDGLTSLAGAFAGDMVGIGDVRDLGREGWKSVNGEEPDMLLVGLAATGLAVTAATWLSAGEASPLRAGLTLIKDARRAGRMSKGLTAAVTRELGRAVDMSVLGKALGRLGSFELGEARRLAASAVRLDRLAPLGAIARDSAAIYRRTDLRGVQQALALAGSAEEVGKIARLSARLGKATRATLKLLGRGAIALLSGLWTLLGWIAAAAFYIYAVCRGARRLGEKLGRVGRGRRLPAARPVPGPFSRSASVRPGSVALQRAA